MGCGSGWFRTDPYIPGKPAVSAGVIIPPKLKKWADLRNFIWNNAQIYSEIRPYIIYIIVNRFFREEYEKALLPGNVAERSEVG